MANEARRIDIEEIGDVTIARFADTTILDQTNIHGIGNELIGLVDEDGRKNILLDFSDVEFLSSEMLGQLIKLEAKVNGADGKLRLCNVSPEIYEVFEITNLNHRFVNYDGVETALESI